MKKLLLAFGFLGAALHLIAVSPFPYTVGVSFSCKLTATGTSVGGGGSMTIYGEGGSPNVGSGGNSGESGVTMAWVRPGKQYTVTYSATVAGYPATGGSYLLSFIAPKGYGLFIDGVQTDLYYRSFSTPTNPTYVADSHTIEVRPLADFSPAAAGNFSGINLGKSVGWEVGVGGLRTGQSAGRIIFKEYDLTNSPASRDRLYFTAPANYGQITTVMDGSSGLTLRQLSVPQSVIDLVDDSGGGYWLKFYTPAQVTWTGSIYTINSGQNPWRTIRVESPGASQLKITETEGSAVRVSSLVLTSGSVSSGTYVWTLQEGNSSTWLRTTTHTSTNNGGTPVTRDDVVVVLTGGTSGTVVAKTKYHYVTQGWGEEVTQIITDPDTAALTTTYAYYATGTAWGNYRQIQSMTDPTGNWVSYLYYDDWNRRGQVQTETRPYVDTPGTVQSADITVGNSVSHDYVADFSGRYRLESDALNKVANVQAGHTVTSPTLAQTRNGLSYTITQSDAFASTGSSDYLRTIAEVIDPASGSNTDYSFLPYSVKRPDQSQDAYAHYLGTYSGTTFTSSGSGTYFRTIVWHGSTNSSGATSFTTYDSKTVPTINLIANQTTMDVIIRNPAGSVVRKETHVYTGGSSFSLITHEDFTYDGAGRLTQRVATGDATVSNTYTNGHLSSTVDVAGTETQFSYDELGRVYTAIKKGVAASGSTYPVQYDITTTYTYDGANRGTRTQVTGGTHTLISTAQFDLAGRLAQQVQYSGVSNALTTGYAYSSGGKIATATLPGSATKVTETYLDGQMKSVTGSSVVAEYFVYSRDGTTGRRSADHRFGSTSSPTITTTTNDWLGRKVTFVQPGWNGTPTTQTWHYNSLGELDKFSQPDIADTLFEYDTLGRQSAQGLDVNGNGTLDRSSDDRISTQSCGIYTWDGGTSWYKFDQSFTFASSGSNSATATGHTLTRMNLGSGDLAQGYVCDINGNNTYQITSVNRAAKVVTTTTIAPDATQWDVRLTYNGLLIDTTDKAGIHMRYRYDDLGRQTQSIDPRTGTTVSVRPGTA
jgi:YD repeat-containing protein